MALPVHGRVAALKHPIWPKWEWASRARTGSDRRTEEMP